MKVVLALASIFYSSLSLACPYCVGTTQGGKDENTTLILSGFILSMYIPYFIILRLIKKQKALKAAHDSTGPA